MEEVIGKRSYLDIWMDGLGLALDLMVCSSLACDLRPLEVYDLAFTT